MSALEELINLIESFTPEQMNKFLNHEVTLSILRPEGASVPSHQTDQE